MKGSLIFLYCKNTERELIILLKISILCNIKIDCFQIYIKRSVKEKTKTNTQTSQVPFFRSASKIILTKKMVFFDKRINRINSNRN